jgi:hypothetical protein
MNRVFVFLFSALFCGTAWCQGVSDPVNNGQFQGYVFEITEDGHLAQAGFEVWNESGDVRITDDSGYFCIPFGKTGNEFESLKIFKEGYLYSSKAFPSWVNYWHFSCQEQNPDTVKIGGGGGSCSVTNPLPDVYGKEGCLQEICFDFPAGALDREYEFHATPYRNLAGYNLGAGKCTNRLETDGLSSFCHFTCGGISIHADGENPEEPIAVHLPSSITIPAPADFDPWYLGGVLTTSYDMLSYDHGLKNWVPNGKVTFLPDRWAFEWSGFSHLSDHVIVPGESRGGFKIFKQPVRAVVGGVPVTNRTFVGGEIEFAQALRKMGCPNPLEVLAGLRDSDNQPVCLDSLMFEDNRNQIQTNCILISANTSLTVDVSASTGISRGNYVENSVRGVFGTSPINPIAKAEVQLEDLAGSSTVVTKEMSFRFQKTYAAIDRRTEICVFVVYELLWETIVHDTGYVSEGLEARASGLGCFRVDSASVYLNNPDADFVVPDGTPGSGPSTPGASNPPGGPKTKNPGGDATVTGSNSGAGRDVKEGLKKKNN